MAALKPEEINRHIGARLRMRRKALGLSLEKVALAVDLSFQQILKYEQGKSRLNVPLLYQLGEVLDVPAVWFLEGLPDNATFQPDTDLHALHAFLLTPDGFRLATAFSQLPAGPNRRKLIEFIEAVGRDAKTTEPAGNATGP